MVSYEKVKDIIIIVLVFNVFVLGIICSKKSDELGRLHNQYRERILDAKRTNNELGTAINECKLECSKLGESVGRNIQTARDAVETIEQVRVQVQYIESIIGNIDWDNYSQSWVYDMGNDEIEEK